MIKKIVLMFFISASLYFAYGIVEGLSQTEVQLKEMKYLYDDQQRIQKRIDEIESRRDELETTMVEYMRGIDRRIKRRDYEGQ